MSRVYLGKNVQSFTKGDSIKPVTHVILNYGYDENGTTVSVEAISTPDNGRTVEKTLETIADGTQAQIIADNILSSFQSVPYESYAAAGGELDPASELGDPVLVNGVYSFLGAISTNFNQSMFADTESQGIDEEDDFGYIPQAKRVQKRIIANEAVDRASISINAEDIRSEVIRATEAESEIGTTISQTADRIRAVITDHENAQARYIQYDAEGLSLGSGNGRRRTLIDDDSVDFYNNSGAVEASVGAAGFDMKTGQIQNQLNLGANWALIPVSDGHLTIKRRT